jgi:hypothetical protein
LFLLFLDRGTPDVPVIGGEIATFILRGYERGGG